MPITAKILYNSFEELLNDRSLSKNLDETAILQENNSLLQNSALKQKKKTTNQ